MSIQMELLEFSERPSILSCSDLNNGLGGRLGAPPGGLPHRRDYTPRRFNRRPGRLGEHLVELGGEAAKGLSVVVN